MKENKKVEIMVFKIKTEVDYSDKNRIQDIITEGLHKFVKNLYNIRNINIGDAEVEYSVSDRSVLFFITYKNDRIKRKEKIDRCFSGHIFKNELYITLLLKEDEEMFYRWFHGLYTIEDLKLFDPNYGGMKTWSEHVKYRKEKQKLAEEVK